MPDLGAAFVLGCPFPEQLPSHPLAVRQLPPRLYLLMLRTSAGH